jgi:hypothetical protein
MAYGLPPIPLREFAEGERFFYMDRLERYLRNKQDEHKRYDWEGNVRSLGGMGDHLLPIPAAYAVPLAGRYPSTRYNLARVIVSNLTQMSFGGFGGSTSFAEINVEGDDVAEAALREWAKVMRLGSRLSEARNFGGAMGTATFSLGIRRGQFQIDVHNPKHCKVLEWESRDDALPRFVVKAYSFERDMIDAEAKKMVKRTFWYVRTWDTQVERVWEALPDAIAKLPEWSNTPPTYETVHGFGFCPFYWTQNLPDSQEEDGEGDYEGLEPKFDEINCLLTATTRGAIKNVDPTLVIKDVDNDDGAPVNKGSGAVIYSRDGAEYLELEGTAVTCARDLVIDLRRSALEEAQVVLPHEEKLTGSAQSAAAMRILYRQMVARCNSLRGQYEPTIKRLLEDVLRIVRGMRTRGDYDVQLPDGTVERRRDVVLPDLDPGTSEQVTLRWPEYFTPTALDVKDTVATAQSASGGKPVISHKTAVDYTSRLFGVEDVEAELKAIEEDAEVEVDRAGEQLEREASAFARARQKPPVEGEAVE